MAGTLNAGAVGRVQIAGQPYAEPEYRIAISRAYYGAYHAVLESVSDPKN